MRSRHCPSSSILRSLLLVSGLLLVACSGSNDPAQEFYLAPEPAASGFSVAGVDIGTGKLSHRETDLSSRTLSLSRSFASQGAGSGEFGGWGHNFSSRLDGEGIPHADWRGLKSRVFSDAEAACTAGWAEIRETAYNGKLADARPVFHEGLCDLYLDSEIVASLPVRFGGGDNPFPYHLLVRPDGTTYTFVPLSKTARGSGGPRPVLRCV